METKDFERIERLGIVVCNFFASLDSFVPDISVDHARRMFILTEKRQILRKYCTLEHDW